MKIIRHHRICSTLAKVQTEVIAIQAKHSYERLWNFFKDPEKINDMKKDLDLAVGLFQVRNICLL